MCMVASLQTPWTPIMPPLKSCPGSWQAPALPVFLLTTGTASKEKIQAVIDACLSYSPSGKGAIPLGVHLEGPYLAEKRKGAQPAEFLRDPDPGEYAAWFESGVIKLMTVAPERQVYLN